MGQKSSEHASARCLQVNINKELKFYSNICLFCCFFYLVSKFQRLSSSTMLSILFLSYFNYFYHYLKVTLIGHFFPSLLYFLKKKVNFKCIILFCEFFDTEKKSSFYNITLSAEYNFHCSINSKCVIFIFPIFIIKYHISLQDTVS